MTPISHRPALREDFVLPILVLLFVSTLPIAAYAQDYDESFAEGMKAYKDEQYERAADAFQRALDQKKTAKAYKFLGHSQYKRDHYDQAEEAFRKAVERNEDFSKLHLLLGQIYIRTDRPEKGVQALRTARSKGHNTGQVHRLLGLALERTGERDLALNAYKMAMITSRAKTELRVKMIQLMQSLQQHRGALRQAQILTKKQPTNTEFQLLLAQAAIKAGNTLEAERALIKAGLLGSSRPALYRSLADLQIQNEQFHPAVRLQRRYMSLVEDPDAQDHYRFGLSLMNTKEFSEAESHLLKAVQQNASYSDGLLRLARTLVRERGFEEARSVLKKLTELDPKNRTAWVYWGNQLMKRQQFGAARKRFARAYQLGMRNENFLINYSHVLIRLGKQKNVRKVLTDALAMYPDNGDLNSTIQKWISDPDK